MLSAEEIRQNRRALNHALAQQRLEGLTVPPETIEELERVVRGEMTTEDALHNARARYMSHPHPQ